MIPDSTPPREPFRTSDSENFTFTDVVDGDEVWVGIRAVEGGTGLALSKKSDGDLEVFLPPDALTRPFSALSPAQST